MLRFVDLFYCVWVDSFLLLIGAKPSRVIYLFRYPIFLTPCHSDLLLMRHVQLAPLPSSSTSYRVGVYVVALEHCIARSKPLDENNDHLSPELSYVVLVILLTPFHIIPNALNILKPVKIAESPTPCRKKQRQILNTKKRKLEKCQVPCHKLRPNASWILPSKKVWLGLTEPLPSKGNEITICRNP